MLDVELDQAAAGRISKWFIRYFASVEDGTPLRWIFFDGRQQDIVEFTPGATLPEEAWEVPKYCDRAGQSKGAEDTLVLASSLGKNWLRLLS